MQEFSGRFFGENVIFPWLMAVLGEFRIKLFPMHGQRPNAMPHSLTVIVHSFSFHRVYVRIVRVLDSENAVDAVSATDAALSSVQRVWSTIAAVAVLRI